MTTEATPFRPIVMGSQPANDTPVLSQHAFAASEQPRSASRKP